MKKILPNILLILLSIITASLLSACAGSDCSSDVPPAAPVFAPCVIPSDLPNTAMGRLGIQVIHIGHTYRIIIPADPVFEGRTDEISETAYAGLTQLARYLQKFPHIRMGVTGYTDSLGSYQEDQQLSERQARSLISYLWTKGVPHECLSPLGIGKDENYTIASNRSIEGSVANRRIEITFKDHSRYD